MAGSSRRLRYKRRLQGVAFLGVVVVLLGLTIAIYNKSLPWQSSDTVTLQTARIGDQLVVPADVKLRGILVGRVSGAHSTGDQTSLTLKIDKSQMANIPADVKAMILPKTLFGEKFVDLVPPAQQTSTATFATMKSAGKPIVIAQDDSSTAIEIQTVFTHLVPLLKTLNPAQLSMTLNAVADALRGRGNELGQTVALTNQYFTSFNKDLPNFTHDIRALATLSSNYADVTPDLLSTLRNFSFNARTFTAKQDVYAQFLAGTAGFAVEGTKVIGDNSNRLINLAKISKPVLDLYSKYSINLECIGNGLAIYDRTRLEAAFDGGPYLHITLTPVNDRGTYDASDRPKESDNLALKPNCYGLPYGNHGLNPIAATIPAPYRRLDNACGGGLTGTTPPGCPAKSPAATAAPTTAGSSGATAGVGSAAEQRKVAKLLQSFGGTAADSSLDDLLVGPMIRGMAVS